MGCIQSRKLNDLKGDVIRVRVVLLLQPEQHPIMSRSGLLELNKKELIFVQQGKESIIWALQHLRRYGLNGDIFSFEAGRRCMSGPGIFTFRCLHQSAERLYQLFQRYVNAVSQITSEEAFGSRSIDQHPSHTLGRLDPNPHSNTYLEPAPALTSMPIIGGMNRIQALQESFSSSPLSMLDSPDSIPSLSFTNEMIHFPSHNDIHNQGRQSSTTNGAPYVNSNLYSEQPLRPSASNSGAFQAQRFFSSNNSAPQEYAPPPMTPEAVHMYANVATGAGKLPPTAECCSESEIEANERCYENLSRMDLPLLLKPPPVREVAKNSQKDKEQQQQPTTPGGVNYIVLDLDQPAQSSPKTCFGSGLSLITGERSDSTSMDLQSPPLTAGLTCMSLKETDEPTHQQSQQQKTESSLGYSTIDFIKTCALIKSSTHGADFELDTDHEADESRITRHSKCVRKAYSISE